ncbi:MAG TPA: hypothetical protein VF414_19200 [Thermoanaerobaculia bacterium]
MTSRPILLFVALSLIASLAGAAVPATSVDDTPEFMVPAVPSPGCNEAELPPGNPAPLFKAGTCGSCSQSICQGSGLNSVCAIQGGRIYKCMNVYGNLCSSSPLTHECYCWYGPLP